MIILAVLVAHNIFNGHFYIHQTDWTSSLNLTDIPWIVEVVHLSLQISSSRFNCTRFLNYFICMHHWKIQKKIHLSDMIIQRWLLHVIFRPILWTHQFCDPALWWWHSARRGRIRRTNQLNQPWLIDWLIERLKKMMVMNIQRFFYFIIEQPTPEPEIRIYLNLNLKSSIIKK